MWNQNTGYQGGKSAGFNRWGQSGANYQNMNGYNHVDYSGGWQPNVHDQMLKNNIDYVFQKYDFNYTGQLEGQEFFNSYKELCLRMGLCPPQNYQEIWNAVMMADSNNNGRVSKMEMLTLFKRIQGVNDMSMNQGTGMGGMGGQGMNVNVGQW